MNERTLNDAKNAAKKFLVSIDRLNLRLRDNKYLNITGSKESATVRRESMDLTRALAALRRPM